MKNHYSEYQYSKSHQNLEIRILKGYGLAVAFITLICIALLLLPLPALAETWIDVHIGSKHSESTYTTQSIQYADDYETTLNYRYITEEKKYNETNLGLGISHGINDHVEVIAGFYNNSINKLSFYAGADVHTSSKKIIRLGASLGVVTGYEEISQKYAMHAVIPNVVVKITDNVRLKYGYIPAVREIPQTHTLSLGFKF